MRNPERWMAFHLSVLTFVVVAIVAALIVEGLGFALIVALALVVILAIGYPAARHHGRRQGPAAGAPAP